MSQINELLRHKRELFHVNIRRNRREETFKQLRKRNVKLGVMKYQLYKTLELGSAWGHQLWEVLHRIQVIMREPCNIILIEWIPQCLQAINEDCHHAMYVWCGLVDVTNASHKKVDAGGQQALMEQSYIEHSCQIMRQLIQGKLFRNSANRQFQCIELMLTSWTSILIRCPIEKIIQSDIIIIIDEIPFNTPTVHIKILNFLYELASKCLPSQSSHLACRSRMVYTLCSICKHIPNKYCYVILCMLIVDEDSEAAVRQILLWQGQMVDVISNAMGATPEDKDLQTLLSLLE